MKAGARARVGDDQADVGQAVAVDVARREHAEDADAVGVSTVVADLEATGEWMAAVAETHVGGRVGRGVRRDDVGEPVAVDVADAGRRLDGQRLPTGERARREREPIGLARSVDHLRAPGARCPAARHEDVGEPVAVDVADDRRVVEAVAGEADRRPGASTGADRSREPSTSSTIVLSAEVRPRRRTRRRPRPSPLTSWDGGGAVAAAAVGAATPHATRAATSVVRQLFVVAIEKPGRWKGQIPSHGAHGHAAPALAAW